MGKRSPFCISQLSVSDYRHALGSAGYDDLQRMAGVRTRVAASDAQKAAPSSAILEQGLDAADIENAWTILNAKQVLRSAARRVFSLHPSHHIISHHRCSVALLQTGSVDLKYFQALVTPLLAHRDSMNAAFKEIATLLADRHDSDRGPAVTMQHLHSLRRIVM